VVKNSVTSMCTELKSGMHPPIAVSTSSSINTAEAVDAVLVFPPVAQAPWPCLAGEDVADGSALDDADRHPSVSSNTMPFSAHRTSVGEREWQATSIGHNSSSWWSSRSCEVDNSK